MNSPVKHSREWFDAHLPGEGRRDDSIPPALRAFSEALCLTYGINGICDPMYIVNVSAYELGCGDGAGTFFPLKEKITPEKIDHLIKRLAGSYGANIPSGDPGLKGIAALFSAASGSIGLSPAVLEDSTAARRVTAPPHTLNGGCPRHYVPSDILAELVDRLPELGGDVSLTAVVEMYPQVQYREPRVFAIQFMSDTPVGAPLRNVATCIPDLQGVDGNWLNVQKPGGRPYEVAINHQVNLADPLDSVLARKFAESSSLITLCRDDQVRAAHLMLKKHGVAATIRDLSEQMPADALAASPHEDAHDVPR